jgi:hypothetical protein
VDAVRCDRDNEAYREYHENNDADYRCGAQPFFVFFLLFFSFPQLLKSLGASVEEKGRHCLI